MGHASLADHRAPLRLAPVSKLLLAAEIVRAYVRVKALLRSLDLPAVLLTLRNIPRSDGRLPLPDIERDGARLGAAVVRTLDALPVDSRCLMRSLVLLELLVRRGQNGSLVIAVRPREAQLDAHAWVELEGRPLLAPADDDHGRLVTL